jgi:5-formyltetrahydrofolate cyclo-ligase
LDQGRFAHIGMVEDAILKSGFSADSKINMLAEKKRLRDHYKHIRTAMAPSQRMQAAEAVAEQFFQQTELSNAGYIAGYWASFGEVPLHVLQMRLPSEAIWCLPVIKNDKTLGFSPWRPGDELVSNHYGIPEPNVSASALLVPQNIDIVLMPLLAYTRDGARLGMGGGYYDRSFAFRHGNRRKPILIGIAYSHQEAEHLPHEEWDVALDMLINEREVLRF